VSNPLDSGRTVADRRAALNVWLKYRLRSTAKPNVTKEGVPLSLSTLADQVGAACAVLESILRHMEAHVFAAGRLHGDDTTVPVMAHRTMLGLRARRSPVRRHRAAGGHVLYSRDPNRRASRGASRQLWILEAACWVQPRLTHRSLLVREPVSHVIGGPKSRGADHLPCCPSSRRCVRLKAEEVTATPNEARKSSIGTEVN
jgi:hypothetical protein